MGKMLRQLRCGGCGTAFWPAEGESSALLVACSACGAPHANTAAMPRRWSDRHPIENHLPLAESVRRWLLAHWVVEALEPYGAEDAGTFERGGFVCQVLLFTHGERSKSIALVPAHAPTPGAPGTWSPAGLTVEGDRRVDAATLAVEAIMQAQASGAVPIRALQEVPNPTPLTRQPAPPADPGRDRALASMQLSCHACGAPSAMSDLVGDGRCPWCGATQRLDPEIARELALYQRRLSAAAAQAPMGWQFGRPRPALPAGAVAMDCVRCGAPNAHRPGALNEACTSCGAPLVAAADAQAVVLASKAQAAGRAHAGQALRRTVIRQNYEGVGSDQRGLLVAGVLFVGLVAAQFTALLLHSRAGLGKLEAYLVAAVFGLLWLGATVVAVLLVRQLDRRRGAAYRAAWSPRYTALAEQLGVPDLGSRSVLLSWAQRWWTDRVAPVWLPSPFLRAVLPTHLQGFPTLLLVALDPTHPHWLRADAKARYAVILLAAKLPRDVVYWAERGDAKALTDRLAQLGFTLSLRSGGLALQATPERVAALRRNPDDLAMLVPVAHAVARLAHLLRAAPP